VLKRLAATALLAGLLTGCASAAATPDAGGPATTPPASAPASTPASSPAALVLGPSGFGPLTLGMKLDAAEATGLLTPVTGSAPDGGCDTRAKLAAGAGAPDGQDGTLYFSPNNGLSSITAYAGVKTPEGIGLGSTQDEAKAAYPSMTVVEESQAAWVPTGTGATYRIGFDKSGKVTSILLQSLKQDCYE
jgi:hypothetical protein